MRRVGGEADGGELLRDAEDLATDQHGGEVVDEEVRDEVHRARQPAGRPEQDRDEEADVALGGVALVAIARVVGPAALDVGADQDDEGVVRHERVRRDGATRRSVDELVAERLQLVGARAQQEEEHRDLLQLARWPPDPISIPLDVR